MIFMKQAITDRSMQMAAVCMAETVSDKYTHELATGL
jgi:hypothetical protein